MSSRLARSTDISTSHAAAAHVVSSGVQSAQQDRAAGALKAHPGLTSMELAKAFAAWRRLSHSHRAE